MKCIQMQIAQMVEMEVPCCPQCGEIPEQKIKLEKTNGSDFIRTITATCPACGLSAPLPVWYSIARAVAKHNDLAETP